MVREELVLDIRSETSNAVKGIQQLNENLDKLASSLTKIGRYSNVFKGGMFGGIKGVDNAFGNLNKTINNIPEQVLPEKYLPVMEATTKQVNSLASSTVAFGKSGVSSFTSLTDSITKSSTGLNGLNSQITQLMGTIGFGAILGESINASKIREANKMFLSLNIDDSEVQEAYNKIQDLVVQLPGNDMFLTSILTLSKSQQPGMSDEDLENLGVATAEYYAAANAKGQFTYETEKELRGYLLSGNTLAFRNSMIAQEIDLLKNKNTIVERANALEEALQRTGFDGMATMDSYANIFERFKGRIEKGFADVGDLMLPLLKGFYELYNTIDAITMSGLTDTLLIIGVSIGVLSATTLTLGFGMTAFRHSFQGIREGIEIFKALNTAELANIRSIKELRFAFSKFFDGVVGMGASNNLRREARIFLTSKDLREHEKYATMFSNIDKTMIKKHNDSLKILSTLKKQGDGKRTLTEMGYLATLTGFNLEGASSKDIEKHFRDLKITEDLEKKLSQLKAQGARGYEASIVAYTAENAAISQNTYEKNLNAIATMEQNVVEVENHTIREMTITSKLRETSSNIKNTISNYANASSIAIVTGAKTNETIENTKNAWSEHFNTIAKWLHVGATDAETTSTNISIASKMRETLVNIKNAISTGIKAAANYVLAISQGAVNSELTITTFLTGILTSELFVIIAVIASVVYVVEKIGEGLGWWSDFGTMIESIKVGLGRLWEAFANSSIIQGVVKLFQTLAHFIGETLRIIGVFLSDLFGGGNGGEFDFVQGIINIFGNLSSILITVWEYSRRFIGIGAIIFGALNPAIGILLIVIGFLEDLGYWLEVIEKGWNKFVNSDDFKDVMKTLDEAGKEIQEIFEPIWDVFAEIGNAISQAFGGDELPNAKNDINELVEVLRWIGNFIKTVIVPLITTVARIVSFIIQFSGVFQVLKLIASITNSDNNPTSDPTSYSNTVRNLPSQYTSTQNLTKTSRTLNNNTTQLNYTVHLEEGAIQNKTAMTNQELEKQYNSITRKNWTNGNSFIGPGARTI